MRLFSRATPSLVGIDITSSAVKVLELARSGRGWRVEHYAIEPLPPGVVSEDAIGNIEPVGEAIKRALARSGSRAKHAVVAVAGASTITKTVLMPADLDGDELEDQVQLEAPNHVPFPLDEVFLDFASLGPAPTAAGMQQVIIAASRLDTVNTRTDALEFAGLTPEIVDVETFAVERAVAAGGIGDGDELVALVDAGHTSTRLHILRSGRIVYSRAQLFGSKQLVDEVMRREGLSPDEAAAKMREGRLLDGLESEVLEPFQEALGQQVSRLLQFFYAASEHNQVARIALAGGAAHLPGLAEALTDQLGIEARVFNPLANMSLGSRVKPEHLAIDGPTLLTVAGLAMREPQA